MFPNFERKLPQEGNDLRNLSFCPLCGAQYASYNGRIISEKEGAYLLHANCPECGSSVMTTFAANQFGISAVGLVTDLTFEDVLKFKDEESIYDDDILEAYNFLENWDGRLEGILY